MMIMMSLVKEISLNMLAVIVRCLIQLVLLGAMYLRVANGSVVREETFLDRISLITWFRQSTRKSVRTIKHSVEAIVTNRPLVRLLGRLWRREDNACSRSFGGVFGQFSL